MRGFLLSASCWFLGWLTFRSWRWRQNVFLSPQLNSIPLNLFFWQWSFKFHGYWIGQKYVWILGPTKGNKSLHNKQSTAFLSLLKYVLYSFPIVSAWKVSLGLWPAPQWCADRTKFHENLVSSVFDIHVGIWQGVGETHGDIK